MFAKEEYRRIQAECKDHATLCVVSKKHSVQEIQEAYDLGQRIFGENRVQELLEKAPQLPKDIEWHFIGHLQRNKVRQVLPLLSCIQSLDSLRLAQVIEQEAAAINKTISCLLEFHLALEDTNKTGLRKEEARAMLEACASFPHIHVEGIMAMGPHTEDDAEIRAVFEEGFQLYESLRTVDPSLQILSMGMSDDYPIALEAGSNLIRIGSRLFLQEV